MIFVYSQPKTGTCSIYESLREHGVHDIRFLHRAGPEGYREDMKYISLVRNPLHRNISNAHQDFMSKTNEEIRDILVSGIWMEDWFDKEFKANLEIDVYKVPFPKEQGFILMDNILLMRTELPDDQKEQLIAHHLGLSKFKLYRRNLTEMKAYSEKYHEFMQTIRFPREYLDRLFSTKSAKHFLNDQEIKGSYLRWCDESPAKVTN